MTRRRGLEPMHDEAVNVTPLIDVVMCLIIFFLLVGRLAKDEVKDLIVPRAKYGQEMADQAGRVMINLVPVGNKDEGGVIGSMNTEPEIWVRGQQKVAMDDLTSYLRTEKKAVPEVKVILRADEDIPYQWIAPVLVACAQADIKNVNFSTRNK